MEASSRSHKDEVLLVNPRAHLRNEGKYVIAAFPRLSEVKVLRLLPLEGFIVSLFDGKRAVEEIKDIVSALADRTSKNPLGDAAAAVEFVIAKHLEPLGDIRTPLLLPISRLEQERRCRIHEYDPRDFIVREDQFRGDDARLTFPVSIQWFLTNECPVHCQYCYMPKMIKNEEMLPWERIKELFGEARNGGVLSCFLSGGDVMCYPHLFELLEVMRELEFSPIQLPTKSHISPQAAARLRESGVVDNVQVSVDSTVPEIADYLVQSPGYLQRAMESIRNLLEAGGPDFVSVKAIITPYTLPTIPKLYRDFHAMGIGTIGLAVYLRSPYRHQDKLFNSPGDFEWLKRQLKKVAEDLSLDKEISIGNAPPSPAPPSPEEKKKAWESRRHCFAGREHLTVCANGKVITCEHMPERDEDYLGDLRAQSIAEVWNGRGVDEYLIHPPRNRFAGTPCLDCDEFDECQTFMGQCVRDSFIHYGTRWHPPSNCPRNAKSPLRYT